MAIKNRDMIHFVNTMEIARRSMKSKVRQIRTRMLHNSDAVYNLFISNKTWRNLIYPTQKAYTYQQLHLLRQVQPDSHQ